MIKPSSLDSVTLHVLHNALGNIAAEMALVMMKTSYSTIFNEGLDFSTVLLDRDGQLIAEKNYTPSMMGAIPNTVRWTLEEFGADYFEPGDVVIHNDPYRGQCHLPEHMVMKPIFDDGAIIGFAGAIGHIADVGGKAPGSFASDATDVYQEGLRLPPVKIVSNGEFNRDVWRIILANHRTPRNTWGDFNAMIGALNVGESRLQGIVHRHSTDVYLQAIDELVSYSERRMRAEIAELPPGRYRAQMQVEDDGVGTENFTVRVAVTIADESVIVDFTGSDRQVRGPMNCTYVVAASAAYNAIFCVTDPQQLIPRNSGCYRPIAILAPAGSVVNVKHPGPSVGGNTDLQPKLIDLLLEALHGAVPDRVAANTGGSSSNLLLGGIQPETGAYFTNYHFDGLGTGGSARADGNSAEITRHSNCRNTPIEVFEHRYPLTTLEYALVPDSGGSGRYRGGLATTRTLRVDAEELTVSALFDRAKIAPRGLAGGLPGKPCQLEVRLAGRDTFQRFDEAFGTGSPTKFTNVVLHRGDLIRYQTAGGGGYGDPLLRQHAAIESDVDDGWVSRESAHRDYGYGRSDDG